MLSAIRSIWIVFKHIFQPFFTVQYPDKKRKLPSRWRGRIVLSRDPRGGERCVACYLCSSACPVACISLQAGLRKNGRRYPKFFRINMSRCIYCGFCEEACPTKAIQLVPDYEMSEFERKNLVYEKEDLLISGTGKYPDYDYYKESGVTPGSTRPSFIRNPQKSKVTDPKSNLP